MTDKISDERLKEISAEYGSMADGLPPQLEDGPGAASAFYMSCSLGEIAAMARELATRRAQSAVVAADLPILTIAHRIQAILAETLTVDEGEIMMVGPASYKIARLFKPAYSAQSAVVGDGVIDEIAKEARRYASFYPAGSDGRNTFVIFAEWVESNATQEGK